MAGLIPVWPFFAPIPGTCDFYLLYRDSLADGTVGGWHEISLCDDRHIWHLLWNPRKREKKALFDLTTSILGESLSGANESIQISVGYLAILMHISSLPRIQPAVSTQFLLMMSDETSVGSEPEPIFSSAVHPL